MKQSDLELVFMAEFKNGNPKALNFVFDLHREQLVSYAEQLLGDPEKASDIVSETFSKMVESADKFTHAFGIRGFLYTVVRNLCFNVLRHDKMKSSSHEEIKYLSKEAADDDTFRNMVRSEYIKSIYQKVDELPNKCRSIFQMLHFQGMTTGEVADLMGISPRNVLNQKQRAIKILKTNFADPKVLHTISILVLSFFICS